MDCGIDRKLPAGQRRRSMRIRNLLPPVAVASVFAAPVLADYEPQAPYVPTVEEDVELMLDLADVGPGDYVIDLGSGDGRIVIAAAKRGVYGHGVEIDPDLVAEARRNARAAGVSERVTFVEGDLFAADIAGASVVTLYLFPEVNIALRPKLLAELAPGTRVVSNSFDMGDWQPDLRDLSARSSGGILLWIVPASVGGDWTLEIEDESSGAAYALRIEQRYQEIDVRFDQREVAEVGDAAGRGSRAFHGGGSPAARDAEHRFPVAEERLHGDRLSFLAEAGGRAYAFSGRVDGDTMSGYVVVRDAAGERLRRWHASR